jgi:hypothetical protein
MRLEPVRRFWWVFICLACLPLSMMFMFQLISQNGVMGTGDTGKHLAMETFLFLSIHFKFGQFSAPILP